MKKKFLVKVMSYNVLNDTVEQNIDQHVTIINDYQPDIIGFQELKPHANDMMAERIGDKYAHIYSSRSNDKEGTPLYYNREKYELITGGTKWISDTPTVFGSKFDVSAYVRIYIYAVLKDRKTGDQFAFVNTHLDYVDAATTLQMKKLLELTAELREENPIVYTADWNMFEDSDAYKIMIDGGMLDSAYAANAKIEKTCGNHRIDFIFPSKKDCTVTKYKTINDHKYSETSSDHYPIYAEIEMEN